MKIFDPKCLRHTHQNWSIKSFGVGAICGVLTVGPVGQEIKQYARALIENPSSYNTAVTCCDDTHIGPSVLVGIVI